MLYLHVSNRTENLLLHLVEVLRSSGRSSPFTREHFLIQSQGMERIISQTMADHFTSWCHFDFMLPMQFLDFCSERLELKGAAKGYEREVMLWRLEELLRDIAGDVYRPIRGYLGGADVPLKRFQLAGQLAHLFDQYQLMRPDMIAAWQQGRMTTPEQAEPWQMDLWQRLREQLPESCHRGELLVRVIEELSGGQEHISSLPERLNVFGISTMVPLFLRFLQALARHCQVHLYVLSPCSQYWGDIQRRRLQPEPTDSHPLLVTLGQQGRDFQNLLFDDVEYEQDFSSYEDPAEDQPSNLLKRLQSDLLRGEVKPAESDWPGEDESIRIVSCHSRIRELGVLKDNIRQWFYDDPSLELRDIIVMAPDIQEYSPLIPAIFDDVHHSVADRSLRRRNNVVSAFSDFLTLFTGRFGWDEVLELLKESPVAAKLNLSPSDLSSIRKWVIDSGIRWGLSGARKKQSGHAAFEESTWKAGLDRMLMGYAIDSDTFVDDIIPFGEIEGSNGVALGGVCRFVSIIEQAADDFSQSYSLADWADLLLEYSEQLFNREGDDSADFRDLQKLLTDLGTETEHFHSGKIDFSVIRAWLERVTRETRSSSGFLRGQLTFCSMLPMRSIPFKYVCLLGINEGEFPKNDHYATFDLMARQHRPGDRSRRMDDRYQFLEALLAAREKLYISYIGQSAKTNEVIPPSVVISELLDILSGHYRAGNLVVLHPLQPYSRRYFDGTDHSLFSYEDHFARVAEKLQSPEREIIPWWHGRVTTAIRDTGWQDFQRFFQHPQRWFVRDCLDIRLTGGVEVVPESELFSHNSLENYLLDQMLLECLIVGENMTQVLKRLQVEGRWQLGTPGELSFADKVEGLREFQQKLEALQPGKRQESLTIDLDISGINLHGVLHNIYEDGILMFRHSRLKAKDCLTGLLHHQLYRRLTGRVVSTLVIGSDRQMIIGGGEEEVPDLETLMEVFVEGCQSPSRLYPEVGFTALEMWEKGKKLGESGITAIESILQKGFEPEIELLLRGCDYSSVFDEEFERLCHAVLEPVRRSVQ